jgi:SAM-dependent methyltransferase
MKIFNIRGQKPWSYGYNPYKWRRLKEYLINNFFNEGQLIKNYGFRIDERIIEYPWFFSRLPKDSGTLLDAGSILNYELIVNQPSLQSKKIFISTLGPEGNCFWKRGISYVFEDLRNCCYRDNYFDWVACISTAEHIGLDNTLLYTDDISKKENNPNTYLNAIREFYRVLKPGGILFLTLPFGKKINRGWFQVFDGNMIDELITVFNPSSVIETHFRYQPKGWVKSDRELSKDATCFDIHQQTEYEPDLAAFSRGIVCLELKK